MYESDSYIAGGGFGTMILPSQVQALPDPTREVVPAAAGFYPGWNYALGRIVDDLQRPLTARTIELMLSDPAVSSSYNTHRMAVLAGGLKLVSPVKQPAWSKRPMTSVKPSTAVDVSEARSLTPEQSKARDIHEFCERSWARLRGNTSFLFELLDAMKAGCSMAEVTFTVPDEGVDAGKLVFDRIACKPNWAWRFVVDAAKRVTGFLCFDPNGGNVVYPPDKFVWLSWMPKDGDPRGTSLFEAARTAWNLKIQAWPAYYKHLYRFGSPGLDFEMALADTTDKQAINADGTPKNDGTFMKTGQYYTTLMGIYQAGGTFIHPFGSKLQIFEPRTNGEAFTQAISLYNTEIKLAIEYQTRASMEAQHGSKADSTTAQDIKDLVASFGRDWIADGLYRAFKLLVRLNYGAEDAERWTPYPTFGNAEGANRGELWSGAASIGFQIGQSQLEEMDDELGLPIRDAEADAAHADEAMKKQADMVAQVKGDDSGLDKGQPPVNGGKP